METPLGKEALTSRLMGSRNESPQGIVGRRRGGDGEDGEMHVLTPPP